MPFKAAKYVERIASIVLLLGFSIWALVPAGKRLNTDFPNYFVAASLYRSRIPLDRVYEWEWFQRQKDRLAIDQPLVGYAPHPPICALPIVPLAGLSAIQAKRVWIMLNFMLLLGAMVLLSQATSLTWSRVALLTMVCALPLKTNFLFGQYYVLILFLICAAYWLHRRNHRLLSECSIGTAASFKIFPILLALMFLYKRDWRPLVGIVLSCSALAMFSILLFGWPVHAVLFIEVLPRALSGDFLGPYDPRSISGVLHHLFIREPQLNPTPVFASTTIYVVCRAGTYAAAVWFALSRMKRRGEEQDGMDWAVFVALMLLLSPMPASYHFSVLVFSVVVAADEWLRESRYTYLGAGVACVILTTLPWPSSLVRLLGMAGFFLLLAMSRTRQSQGAGGREAVGIASLAALPMLVSQLGGTASHVAILPTEGYRAGSPVWWNGRLAYTQMYPLGYRAVDASHEPLWPAGEGGDVLSLAATADGRHLYFETSQRHSTIGVLSLDPVPLRRLLIEGQQPSVSPSGDWLAFIREQHGKGQLWIRQRSAPEQPLSPLSIDVLEASIDDKGDVVASVGPSSRPSLMLFDRTAAAEQHMPIAGAVRYPAIAPDGRHIAFSKRHRGAWHLYVYDRTSGTEQQMTSGACNATRPSWIDNYRLLYTEDCGRGLDLNGVALASLLPERVSDKDSSKDGASLKK